MLPENFQPKRRKNTFNFLLNSVWKTNSSLPFPHHTVHFCSDGSGIFSTTSELTPRVGDTFMVDSCEFEIDLIEVEEFAFDKSLTCTTVYFFSPNHND